MNTTKSLTHSIFISYAHEDEEFRANILKPLRALEDKYQVELWDDTCIKVGDEWEGKIQTSLRKARVAMLLISQDFSASNYIRRFELPVLRERYNNNELKLIGVIIGKVDLEPLELGKFQTIPPPEQPIKFLSKKARENVYYDISIVIREILEGLNEESSDYNHNNGIQAPLSVLSIDQPKLWTSIVPALMGKDEIEKQLNLLINHTKSTGNLIFTRSPLSQNSCRLKFLKKIKFEIRYENVYKVF
jgi:TIR domain